MHVPDGFFNAGASVGAGVAAAGSLAVAVRRTRDVLTDRQVPLAALTAAFVFAAQMINVPIAAGTSGHLLGTTLAVVLVGPWTGIIAVSVVVVVQALLFADGGLTALGLNVVLIAVVPGLVGYAAFRALRAVLPRAEGSVTAAAGVAAGLSVPAAAAAFSVLYLAAGSADVSATSLLAAMVGIHTVIGVGEGVITALALGAVLAARPDVVHGADHLQAAPALAGSGR